MLVSTEEKSRTDAVYAGKIANNGIEAIPRLIPGDYTVTLSGADIGYIPRTRLPDDLKDNRLPDDLKDNRLANVYLPDNVLADMPLGSETDPYNEYAIGLN